MQTAISLIPCTWRGLRFSTMQLTHFILEMQLITHHCLQDGGLSLKAQLVLAFETSQCCLLHLWCDAAHGTCMALALWRPSLTKGEWWVNILKYYCRVDGLLTFTTVIGLSSGLDGIWRHGCDGTCGLTFHLPSAQELGVAWSWSAFGNRQKGDNNYIEDTWNI